MVKSRLQAIPALLFPQYKRPDTKTFAKPTGHKPPSPFKSRNLIVEILVPYALDRYSLDAGIRAGFPPMPRKMHRAFTLKLVRRIQVG